MKQLLSVLIMMSTLGLAGAEPQSHVTFSMAAERVSFGTEDAPLPLTFTFMNAGKHPFVVCPNRIEIQHHIKFIVVRDPSQFPTNAPEWESINSEIADYSYEDAERYVTLRPGESYQLQDDYFANNSSSYKRLLDLARPKERHDGHRGVYYVKAYFNGKAQPVIDAPATTRKDLLQSRLESNVVKLFVGERQTNNDPNKPPNATARKLADR